MTQTCARGTARRFAAALLCLCLLCAAILPAAHAESGAPAGPGAAETDAAAPEGNDGTQEPANGDAQDAADGEMQAIANDAPLPAANEGIMPIASGTAGDFTVDPNDGGWNYNSGVLTFTSNGTYTVSGDGTPTKDRIVISANFNGTIILKDVNIDLSSTGGGSPFHACDGNYAGLSLKIELQGTNILRAGGNDPDLEFNGKKYNIFMEISGEGSLTAYGGENAAGIGSRRNQPTCNITISGGTIIAHGGANAAGIGAGRNDGGQRVAPSATNIRITGGTVTAYGGTDAPAIGAVGDADSEIHISGGSVKASGFGKTPPNDSDWNPVYLLTLNNYSGVNSVNVGGLGEFNRNGNHPDDDGTFYLYLPHISANEPYKTTAAGKDDCYACWETDHFVIKSGRAAPTTPEAVDESILGKNDGRITGTTAEMEYRSDGIWYEVDSDSIENLPPGKYYVRYRETKDYIASQAKEVTVGAGRPLTVTLPEDQVGYTLTAEPSGELSYNTEVKLTFTLKPGYSETEDFAVKVNGETKLLDSKNTTWTASITENKTVTVDGVADVTPPENVTLTVGDESWSSPEPEVSFKKFYNAVPSVTLTAADLGSGMPDADGGLFYYYSAEALDPKTLSDGDWLPYKAPIELPAEDGHYVVYAKAVDKVGNITYLNSDGYILDRTLPVIKGVKDGETVYGDAHFTVTEKYLKEVTVDGEPVEANENGVYTIPADNGKHTITVTDEAGNTVTCTVTVEQVYDVKGLGTGGGVTVSSEEEARHGQDYTFHVQIQPGYRKSAGFGVWVNGKLIPPNPDGSYTVPAEDVTGTLVIRVVGVEPIPAPSGGGGPAQEEDDPWPAPLPASALARSRIPATGDAFAPALWAALFLGSAAGLTILLAFRRSRARHSRRR